MKTKINIHITSRQIMIRTVTAAQAQAALNESDTECDDTIQISSEGYLIVEDGRVTVEYTETELTGMAGSVTRLCFDTANPGLVTMLREGEVTTVLVFERGKQHICTYQTPYMPFELTVRTYRVVNELLESGYIYLDYTLEVRGARIDRTKFTLEISAADTSLADLLAHEALPEVPQS